MEAQGPPNWPRLGDSKGSFQNDLLYRQQLAPKGWSDENIHMLEELGESAGQNPSASYNPEAARMAFRRTARLERAAEEVACRRGEDKWWSTNENTWSTTEWDDWHCHNSLTDQTWAAGSSNQSSHPTYPNPTSWQLMAALAASEPHHLIEEAD